MDSLTQITLGAAIGAAIMGKIHGRKAALLGAICGTIPDLDSFIPMGDPVSDMTYHRGFSHSLLFCVLATPLFVWLFSKIKWFGISFKDKSVHVSVFLMFLTHVLLDAMTIYGTQLFWPLPIEPVGLGSVFIIDPLYTLPFLMFLIWFLINKSQRAIYIGLIISTLYLGWSALVQSHVYNLVEKQGVIGEQILAQPTPFNTILWRVVVMNEDEYKVGYYSLFDTNAQIDFETFDNPEHILPDNWAVNRMKWFSKGFYSARNEGDDIVMSDLRMGLEPDQYAFQFVVNKEPNERFQSPRDMSRLKNIWSRLIRDL